MDPERITTVEVWREGNSHPPASQACLLLYGPPGTGKTHTALPARRAADLTVVLLSGPSIQFLADATRMARALQPALVVPEDCDLAAENRDVAPGAQPLLFEVLEALDGLSDDDLTQAAHVMLDEAQTITRSLLGSADIG